MEKVSSTTVQSPSTMELLSVKSVAEPILHSSPDEEVPKVINKLHVENVLTLVLNTGCFLDVDFSRRV